MSRNLKYSKKVKLGIEIEFTGIKKDETTKVVAEYLNSTVECVIDGYGTRKIIQEYGRAWKIINDDSIRCEKKLNGGIILANNKYICELASQTLTYKEDIDNLLEIIRLRRKAGAFTNSSCEIQNSRSKIKEHGFSFFCI